MTRYAIAPPRVGARFIVKQPIWKPGALTRGFGTARGYPGNRRRWRDRPATMRTSCLRGFRKRKITAWSLKHLRRGAVVDSDGMAYFWAAAKAGYAYPDTDRGDNTLLRNLALPLDNTCHGWGPPIRAALPPRVFRSSQPRLPIRRDGPSTCLRRTTDSATVAFPGNFG